MYCPLLEISSFHEMGDEEQARVLRFYLEALTYANVVYLRSHGVPDLYAVKPAYALKNRPYGLDVWQDIRATLQKGSGDCKDFVCWRMAERRGRGEKGLEFVVQKAFDSELGEEVFHCTISDGEDPTAILRGS